MFSELSITSNFSFLQGASHPEEYMERGVLLGLSAIAIADVIDIEKYNCRCVAILCLWRSLHEESPTMQRTASSGF